MKRFTLILSLLVAMVTTAMAQTATTYADGVYKIFWEGDQRGYLTYHADYPDDPQLAGVVNHNPTGHYQLTDEGIQLSWYLYTSENTGKSYLFEATTGKFIVVDLANGSGGNGRRCALSEEVTEYAQLDLMLNTAGTYNILSYNSDEYGVINLCSGCGTNKGQGPVRFTTDGEGDGGVPFKFVADGASITDEIKNAAIAKIEVFESNLVDVTYTFTYGGETIYTQTATVEKGAAYPAIDTTKFAFGFTATTPTGTVDTDTEKTIELTATFSWADSYGNITAWYYLDLKDGKYLFYEEGQENIPLNKTSVDSNNKDAYTWGFIGDPVNGFQIVNYAAGSSMILSSTTNTFDGNTGGNTYPVMTATPVPAGNNTHWVFTASTYRENGFYIGQKDANNGNNKLNNRDGKLAYWNSGADAGSTFIMTERPMGATAELEALIAEIEAKGITSGTNPGEYTEASVNALNEAIATAKAVETATAEDVEALQAAYDALTVNPITAGTYRIVSAYSSFNETKAISVYGYDTYYSEHRTPAWAPENTNDPLQYWVLEENGTGFNIKAAYEGNYITTATSMSSTAKAATFTSLDKAQFNITLAGDEKPIHANGWNWGTAAAPLTTWNGGVDSPSAWRLIAVDETPSFTHTLSVTEAGWATLMLGFNATIPAEVTAYTIASQEDGYVTLAKAIGVLKANVPVLVEAAKGDYVFAYTHEDATVTESGLEGTLYPKNIVPEGKAYVLGKVDDVVGLYLAELNEAEGTAFLNNANKAYFVPTNAQANIASYSFRFGEGTTGIEEITDNREQSTVIYDLTGRRVEAITAPGIYVVNGKKVLVK